jgi:cell wall-associated NlpC family hydrolase
LYSTGTVGSPADVAALRTDRGQPVLNVGLNTVPDGVSATTWQQQRILAAANGLLQAGTHYQHLHMPNFDPRQVTSGTGFPWSPVSTNPYLKSTVDLDQGLSGTVPNPYAATYGSPQPGIDCTDFSSYVYNLALGIQMHSGTPNQVTFGGSGTLAPGNTAYATVLDSSGNPLAPQFFYGPNFGTAVHNGTNSLTTLVSQFQPGDLLYMGNPTDNLVHVVMWLGQTGTDSSGNTFPLVISSHDNTPAIFDTLDLDATGFPSDGNISGHLPPPGVHILPFDASNWFYQDFQLAMRVVAVPEPSTWVMGLAGIACGGCRVWRRRRLVRRA